jgi:shikimate dehydrogenase
MDNNSRPKIYGVLGYPARHSLSPEMHNAAFRALKINAEYKIFEIAPQELGHFLEGMGNDIYGLNVTVPYKERILSFISLDRASLYLKQLRAVNTIVKTDNTWKGFNTDLPGFFRHLTENFDPKGKRVAILGAGGAARAVSYVLAQSAKEISIFDIDNAKAESVAEMIKGFFPGFPISSMASIEELKIRDKDLLVNATPVGLKGSDPSPVGAEDLHKHLFVYDLIYNPAETKLLALAKKSGAKSANGLGMLLYQGALSFEHFTAREPPLEVMRRALNQGVAKL